MKFLTLSLFCLLFITGSASAQTMWWGMKPEDVRSEINQRIFAIDAERPEVARVSDITITQGQLTIPLRIYTPSETKNLPIILFIHGGGWVAGSLETHDNMARYLCRETEALVVSVGYTNSPEGKFPLALEQCYEALQWIAKHAHEYQADPARLAVVGDSVGGNMAAALTLLARDRHGPAIVLQVLINPSPDLIRGGTLERQNDAFDMMRWFAVQYLSNPKEAVDPYASPIFAKNLGNLPPAVVILAENDDLRADGQKYADRLISADIPTRIYIQKGVGHLAGNGARASKLAQESLDVAAASLRDAFSPLSIVRPSRP